jgi:pyruvate carboxylase subunit A
MEIFTLHSEDNIKNEEEKIANIMKLMEAINKNKLKVKH